MVTGAAGQDGRLLVRRLVDEGSVVHALTHEGSAESGGSPSPPSPSAAFTHRVDLLRPESIATLIATVRPDEFYNLAGLSSVAASFDDPWLAWRTNAEAVSVMLEAVRTGSPGTRFYQASSSEMFGGVSEDDVRNESSPLRPESPYAAAKAAAHLLCNSYRESFGLRIACGVLFNHESRLRPTQFLTRKVADHVRRLNGRPGQIPSHHPPLRVGNLNARRDWGFAPEFVDGIVRILRQVEVRNALEPDCPIADNGTEYRDYVLGTGHTWSVRDLVDRAFSLVGHDLAWDLSSTDQREWSAAFASTGATAVVVDPDVVRPTDPRSIRADPSAALRDLGWAPTVGLDSFLMDMIHGADEVPGAASPPR
jgi:GDPmannose 4,6-dehydratase